MRIIDLASDSIVRRTVEEVTDRFLNLKRPTLRPQVHKSLQGRGNLIDQLLQYEFLRQPVDEYLVPGIVAFQHCVHQAILDLAKEGTKTVLLTLRGLFDNDYSKRRFTFDEIWQHAEKLFPHVLPEEIRAGLLLAPDLAPFIASLEWNEDRSTLKWIAVRDQILDFKSIDEEWQKKLDQLKDRELREHARLGGNDEMKVDSAVTVNDSTSPIPDEKLNPMINRKKIFVIHGRNEKLRRSMFEFLRALGLDPLGWSELLASTGKGSPYNGEVVDKGFEQAAAVVALLTPDDYAFLNPSLWNEGDKSHEREPTPQARPNVLFELGMAFAHHPERTIIVEIGELRPFSDIAGRQTIRFDGTDPKRLDLRNRLKAAGCEVNEYSTDFLKAGDFTTEPPQSFILDLPKRSVGARAVVGEVDTKTDREVRRAYSFAISILRGLHGEFFGANQGLPGYLWSGKDPNWIKICNRLGAVNGVTGKFMPYTEPSQFDGADSEKLKAASNILELYLWGAENSSDFEAIRAAYDLPTAEEVQNS